MTIRYEKLKHAQFVSLTYHSTQSQFSGASLNARILIAGHAPGLKVHHSGVSFDDQSGDRLRDWMGISKHDFYRSNKVSVLPLGFCYPGTGKYGDLPQRKECAPAWREQMLELMPNITLTLLVGQFGIGWHLRQRKKENLTETVRAWKDYAPLFIPLPHPSPRNNIWLKKNPWFEKEVIPVLKEPVSKALW